MSDEFVTVNMVGHLSCVIKDIFTGETTYRRVRNLHSTRILRSTIEYMMDTNIFAVHCYMKKIRGKLVCVKEYLITPFEYTGGNTHMQIPYKDRKKMYDFCNSIALYKMNVVMSDYYCIEIDGEISDITEVHPFIPLNLKKYHKSKQNNVIIADGGRLGEISIGSGYREGYLIISAETYCYILGIIKTISPGTNLSDENKYMMIEVVTKLNKYIPLEKIAKYRREKLLK